MSGAQGDDRLEGGLGTDTLYGGGGNDELEGGDAGDSLYGGRGSDLLSGGADEDTIRTTDGERDTIRCGGGHDIAYVDPVDVVVAVDCEAIRIVRRG